MSPSGQQSNTPIFRVLVTGFGAFDNHVVNPSYLVAQELPKTYHPPGSPALAQIAFFVHPDPLEVSYQRIAALIPSLVLAPDGKAFDLVLLLGLASNQTSFSIESSARRDGYTRKDIYGQLPAPERWQGLATVPPRLRPTFDLADVHRRWVHRLPGKDLGLSDDAGGFLCEYSYFAAMLEYWHRGEEGQRPCIFLHVPPGAEVEDLHRGREVILALTIVLWEMCRGTGTGMRDD